MAAARRASHSRSKSHQPPAKQSHCALLTSAGSEQHIDSLFSPTHSSITLYSIRTMQMSKPPSLCSGNTGPRKQGRQSKSGTGVRAAQVPKSSETKTRFHRTRCGRRLPRCGVPGAVAALGGRWGCRRERGGCASKGIGRGETLTALRSSLRGQSRIDNCAPGWLGRTGGLLCPIPLVSPTAQPVPDVTGAYVFLIFLSARVLLLCTP